MKTSVNLLRRAGNEQDSAAWTRLVKIYSPLISGWLTQAGVSKDDVEDVCQDVLSSMTRGLRNFRHSGRKGAFRNWLRNITVNQCRQYRKRTRKHSDVSNGSTANRFLDHLADPKTDLSKRWNLEHDQHILQAIIEKLSHEFDRSAMQAFHDLVLCRGPAAQTAQDLGLSVREVLTLSAQVMKRVSQEAAVFTQENDDWTDSDPTTDSSPPEPDRFPE